MSQFFEPVSLGPVSVQCVQVFFPVAGIETPVPHKLGVVAMGGAVLTLDKAAIINSGVTPPASNVLFMVSDTDRVTATILVVAINFQGR